MRSFVATLALAGTLVLVSNKTASAQEPGDRLGVPAADAPAARRVADRRTIRRQARGNSLSLAHVVGPLASKARELASSCGSTVISAVRHTRIAGTGGRLSLHASGRAVDLQGNPGCMYAHLQGWPGGVSIDYGRMRHVHVSYAPGGAEWGLRFRHGGGGRHHRRHAHRS